MNQHSNQTWKTSKSNSIDLKRFLTDESPDFGRQNILEAFNFPDMIEDYLIELEIRNYSRNTIKTYRSIINNFYNFLQAEEELNSEQLVLRTFKRYIRYLKREKNNFSELYLSGDSGG